MVGPRTQEIYGDIVHYSNVILDILKEYDATSDTPDGRIIYQCEWLIQEVKASTSMFIGFFWTSINSLCAAVFTQSVTTTKFAIGEEAI